MGLLEAAWLGYKFGVEALRRSGGGSIVNVSSALGIRGGSGLPAWCASKGAGAIDTPMLDLYVQDAPTREQCA
jgi:NAD(P)-dependent dehydrogenase (short-subunit alcohol dehydrogenase family)